ncbi:MAG: hypothetical protein ABF649_18965, partial [Bacillus sp. (in: firmicutes)]
MQTLFLINRGLLSVSGCSLSAGRALSLRTIKIGSFIKFVVMLKQGAAGIHEDSYGISGTGETPQEFTEATEKPIVFLLVIYDRKK